jgi:copper chaperone NosL
MITRRSMMLFVLALAACENDHDRAVEPVWGKQPCEHCRMLLSHKPSAGQLVRDGQRYYFDDLGCMARWLDEQRVTVRAWVRQGDQWVDAEQARYRDDASTPMDYGFVPAAEGRITWTQLRARVANQGGPS